jgi:formyltetrahydrofolate deformylase
MAPQNQPDIGRLIVQGTDRPGIVAAVSSTLANLGANIISLDQHTSDPTGGKFFQRTVFDLNDLGNRMEELHELFDTKLTAEVGVDYRLVEASKRKRVAVLASKSDNCPLDLLWRQRRGEIPMTVPMVISNHPDLGNDVRHLGIPYFHVPVSKGSKAESEKELLNLLKGNVDAVVLARYMQILSSDFLEEVGVPVINIHHSFLPAFIGAGPYERAKERGVKLIGATAHYVTEDLDEGPIIEQDVVRARHFDTANDLKRRGADVERQVLARAVTWHCNDRVIRDGNATIVF